MARKIKAKVTYKKKAHAKPKAFWGAAIKVAKNVVSGKKKGKEKDKPEVHTSTSIQKDREVPKAILGAAVQAGFGIKQMRDAKKAKEAFDTNRLKDEVSAAGREMADQPIDENIVKQQQENALVMHAQTMGNVVKGDQRNVQSAATQSQDTAQKGLLEQAIEENAAKTTAMQNLSDEQVRVKGVSIGVAQQELGGINAERDAGIKNLFDGIQSAEEQAASFFSMGKNGASVKAEKGANVEAEVTPGKFSHEENPIDMVQDGEKIGEATGGELILPPKDVDEIREALDGGDKDVAFKLMEELVAKYDKNVIEAEEEEGGATQGEGVPPMMDKGGYLKKVKARMGAYMKSKY